MGGGQERDRRSGTHNVAGIVAMAEAMRATVAERAATVRRRGGAARPAASTGCSAERGRRCARPCPPDRKVAGSAHVCIEGVESEALLFLLDRGRRVRVGGLGVRSGAMEPSHVLAAMGVPATWRPGRCACRSGRRRPTPTSTAPSRCCRRPSPGCGRRAPVG